VNVVVSAEIGTNISAENERVFDTLNKVRSKLYIICDNRGQLSVLTLSFQMKLNSCKRSELIKTVRKNV
jgi:hypothetical protein